MGLAAHRPEGLGLKGRMRRCKCSPGIDPAPLCALPAPFQAQRRPRLPPPRLLTNVTNTKNPFRLYLNAGGRQKPDRDLPLHCFSGAMNPG